MKAEQWSRVKDLLQAALDREQVERADYLANACGEDDVLRREVESLLLACERAEALFETPAVAWVDGTPPDTQRVRRIGPYRILREIGRGGMAAVYLAVRDDGEYRKEVAIKVVQNVFASEYILERFRQERQILAELEHENIARLLDGGTTEDGLPFLVLEYVAGVPIDVYCDDRQLSLVERLTLFREVCSAVSYAHQRLIIHRDLKPSNILVTPEGTPKLLDFGIAKLLDGSGQSGDRTLTGLRLMTPEYASPEQLRGEPVGVPADVHALGVLLYRLATGRRPYRQDTDQPHEIARAICEDEAVMPSALLGRPDLGEVTSDLDAILMKALSKEPRDRYATVELFADDVRRYLDGKPVAARKPSAVYRLRRLMGHPRRRSVAAAGILATVITLSVVVTSRKSGESDRADFVPMSLSTLTTLTGSVSGPAFSRDGKVIAFTWTGDENGGARPGIYAVPVTGGTPVLLTRGGSDEAWPAWSPDGKQLAFVRQVSRQSGIFSVPASGGHERKLLDLRPDRYHWLAWSPDAKHLAFAVRDSEAQPYTLSLLSLDTLSRRRLPSSVPAPGRSVLRFAFSPDGQTLAFIANGLQTIDVCLISLADEKTRCIYSHPEWIGGLAWTADGRALVLSLNQRGTRRLMKLPVAGGSPDPLTIAGDDAYYPVVSRNGSRLAFVRELADTDLWRVALDASVGRSNPAPLIRSTRRDAEPRFSPDGKKIAFQSNRGGSLEIWVSDADGTNQIQLTSFKGPNVAWPTWSPDGRELLLGGGILYVLPSAGGTPRPVKGAEPGSELASWSHDGRWIYFEFAARGNPNIWRVPAEGGQAEQVTVNGAFSFQESTDGRYLYYTKHDKSGIWRAPVSGGQETCVIEEFAQQFTDYWDVVSDGIYFADPTTSPFPSVNFFSFATKRKSPVATLAGPLVEWGGGLTVAPDRRSIVYTQHTYSRSELVLVDNFR